MNYCNNSDNVYELDYLHILFINISSMTYIL